MFDSYTDEELTQLLVDADRRRNQAEYELTAVVREVERRGMPQGPASAASWVSWKTRQPRGRVKAMLANGRALESMPEVAAAFEAGDIGRDHVSVLAAAARTAPKEFAKGEEQLLAHARELRFDVFRRRVMYWRQEAEPDRVEDEAQERFERRRLHLSKTFEDTWQLDGLLDPVGGGIFANELRRLEQQLFEADWKEARARLGDAVRATDLRRTPAQRRADAGALMAVRSAMMPENAKQARVLLQVLVGYETFAGRICELADGTVLSPGEVVSLLDDADVQRVVFGSPSVVLDLGRRERLFKGGTRTAVQLADLECQAQPWCEVRFTDCQVDHLQPWEWGGETNRANGGLKCKWHHRHRPRP